MIEIPETNLYGEQLTKYLQDKLWKPVTDERERLKQFKLWRRGEQDCPYLAAKHRNTERQVLQNLSRTPWMGLMINTFSQQLIVDGYKKAGSNDNAKGWETWLRNEMAKQQFTLNADILTYGYSFVRVTDSVDPITKKPMASIRARSPFQVFALYEDPYMDDWPKFVLERQPNGQYWWWSDTDYVVLNIKDGRDFEVVDVVDHDYGLVPFVRYVNDIDTDGRCWGDIEPVIELAKRIDKTGFDILLTQHFTGFIVRWATGLMKPEHMTEDDVEQDKLRLAQEDILISSNKEAKFGTLPPGPLEGLLEAYRENLKAWLAVCQLPPNIAGQIVNVAADALAAGTRQTVQKLHMKQTLFAAGHNQVLRLVNMLEGREEDAADVNFSVHWQDVEIKSLAQFADAWGKIVEQLKVPAWGVWNKIPDVDQSEVEGWREDYLSNDDVIAYVRMLQEGKLRGGAAGQDARGGPNSAQNRPPVNNKTGDPASLNRQQPGAR